MAKVKKIRARLSSRERQNLFTDLATMLSAGIPILEALNSLQKDSTGNMKKVLTHLSKALDNGETLSRAMSQMSNAFDPISINLVSAAEASGTLEETLTDLVRITKKDMAFNAELRTAMIYPIFVTTIFFGIILLMLVFVIPRISKTFLSLKVKLPITTRFMFAASDYFLAHWLMIILGIAAGIFLFSLFVYFQKRLITRWILSLPGLRTLGRDIDLRRFTRSFELLLKAGLPLDEVLNLSQKVVQKKQMITVVEHMKANIVSGKQLSDGLREYKKVIPPVMSRSIETAEQSGTLEKTMLRLSKHFDEQVDQRLKLISSLMEPILLVIIGGMVGFLMISIMAPMYSLMSKVQGTTPH